MKYHIFCEGNPAILVARASTEAELMDLLGRLGRLTVEDFRAAERAAATERKEMVSQLVERARNMAEPVDTEHHPVPASDYLQDHARLERQLAAREQELERRNQELREEQQKHQQLQERVMEMVSRDQVGDPGTAGDASAQVRPAVPSRAAQKLSSHALLASSADPMPMPSQRPTTGDAEMEAADQLNLEGLSFAEKVLLPPYTDSLARKYWQLAAATYQEVSCNRGSKYVALDGELWTVIAEDSDSNMCVIGRKIPRTDKTTILELGFRGAVMKDCYGETDVKNWLSTFDMAAAPLHRPNGENEEVQVHRGSLLSYWELSCPGALRDRCWSPPNGPTKVSD